MRGTIGWLAALLLATPALADEVGQGAAARQRHGDGQIEERIQELEAKRARLLEERDAARVRANTYVLPKDKLEVVEKSEAIEEVDEELRALEKEKERQGRATRREDAGPR